ncbi:MAG: acyltransferase domain-containing protein, partial [Planctomycetaceae bacterium]|nr:acyltransferase domain-containing protein [Planctomycetaceae bacterium]
RLRDVAGPPLTANRTMGALGGLVASRIAREFRVGGPSFTVSSEETSGARALDVAVRLLRRGELDEAIVGAVDLACDVRAVLSADRVHPYAPGGTVRPLAAGADGTVPADGAAVLILKRLDRAVADGDRVYAVIRGLGAAGGGDVPAYLAAMRRAHGEAGVAPSQVGYLEAHGSGRADEDRLEASALAEAARGWPRGASCALGSSKGDVGHAGAASALVAVVKAALCLHQQVLPPIRGGGTLRPELAASPFFAPRGPQFWLSDRAEGPRRAAVAALGVDGNLHGIVLEAHEPARALETVDRAQPLGARPLALLAIEADDPSGLIRGIGELDALAARSPDAPIEALAREWWRDHRNGSRRRLGLALVADCPATLRDQLATARAHAETGSTFFPLPPGDGLGEGGPGLGRHPDLTLTLSQREKGPEQSPLGPGAGLAFVFPGMGNQFAGMGRDLSALWPEVLRAQDEESDVLRSMMAPGACWNADPPATFDDHRAPMLGQVAFGTMAADLLRRFGLAPDAVIGYSLGESSGLFALRAWTGRDEILRRMAASPLFRTELAGPCEAARRAWGLAEGEPVDWLAGIVPCPAAQVRAALAGRSRVYLLIVNTPGEVVVGGRRDEVRRLVRDVGGRFLPLPLVSTVHCEVARQVEEAYRALHLLETTPPPGVRFYSGATARAYVPDRDSAADAIVAQAVHGFDFPAVIERAYADGVRAFVEVGPGASCTRMISAILGDRPHLAHPASVAGQDALATVLDLLGHLIAARVPVDLAPLYGRETTVTAHLPEPPEPPRRLLRVPVGGRPFANPPWPPGRSDGREAPRSGTVRRADRSDDAEVNRWVRAADPTNDRSDAPAMPDLDTTPTPIPMGSVAHTKSPTPNPGEWPMAPTFAGLSDPLGRQLLASQAGRAEAHEAFLHVSTNLAETMSNQLAFQMALIEALTAESPEAIPALEWTPAEPPPTHALEGDKDTAPEEVVPPAVERGPRPALDRDQCLEFAVGSIAKVLGPEFAPVDAHPTRVRLPDEPLMLVDRILTIEGEPRSLSNGRVVTEKDVRAEDWYLDDGRIPTCIAVESGQADLFLSGYLGIDFVTKGLAVYRLLDAAVTFHRGLPGPGAVIRYDIRIASFFRQGDTYLFRFHFEATVGGAPLMSMRDGCAGFFTAEALAAGKGIVRQPLDLEPRPGVRPDVWEDLVPMAPQSLDDAQIEALRRGDLAGAFGPRFAGLPLRDPARLPGGRMTLVHRVPSLDPAGGRFGLGLIRGEADIHPDDWFMTCHFVDDRVMPGTLMYECCLHTLRVFLMRLGWVGERDEVACEPVPGVASRLKCRGQVIESTR